MRTIFTLVLFMSLPLHSAEGSDVKDCKIERTDGVVVYGQCYQAGSVYIFRSCIEFTCQVSPQLTRKLDKGEESCLAPISGDKFKALVLKEHEVKKVSEVKFCNYGKQD